MKEFSGEKIACEETFLLFIYIAKVGPKNILFDKTDSQLANFNLEKVKVVVNIFA